MISRFAVRFCCLFSVLLLLAGCRSTRPASLEDHATAGIASYYGAQYHGRKTANGERFDMNKLTAAHRTLPFGQEVRVVNLENGRSVIVRINDRGPFVKGRIIDVSPAAARKLDFVRAGTTKVRLEILGR